MKKILYFSFILFFLTTEVFSEEKNKDLLDLKKLLDNGVITTEEYNSAKEIISKKGYKEKVLKSKEEKKEVIVKDKTVILNNTNKIDKKTRIKKNELWKNQIQSAIEEEKNDPFCKIVTKKTKEKKLNYCLKKSDIFKLGYYEKFQPPKFILDNIKGCKSYSCIRKMSGQKVYKIFVQRGAKYHERHPGDMIKGMVWFEIFYIDSLKKNQKLIIKYFDNQNDLTKKDKKKLHSLIKTNKGRIKMREALGFNLYDNLHEVIESQWLLAEFLNKDKLKVTQVKLSPQMLKRKKLIDRYKSVLKKYKAKLEEEKEKQNKKNGKKS